MKKKLMCLALAAMLLAGVLVMGGCSSDPAANDEYYDEKVAIVEAINKSAEQGQFCMVLNEKLVPVDEAEADYEGRSDCTTEYWYQQVDDTYFYRHSYVNNYNGSAAYAVGDGRSGKFFGLADGKVDISASLGKPLSALGMIDLYYITTTDEYASMVEKVETEQKGENTVYTLVINVKDSWEMPDMTCRYAYEVTPDGLLAGFVSMAEGEDENGVRVRMNGECTITYNLDRDQLAEMEALYAQLPA